MSPFRARSSRRASHADDIAYCPVRPTRHLLLRRLNVDGLPLLARSVPVKEQVSRNVYSWIDY